MPMVPYVAGTSVWTLDHAKLLRGLVIEAVPILTNQKRKAVKKQHVISESCNR